MKSAILLGNWLTILDDFRNSSVRRDVTRLAKTDAALSTNLVFPRKSLSCYQFTDSASWLALTQQIRSWHASGTIVATERRRPAEPIGYQFRDADPYPKTEHSPRKAAATGEEAHHALIGFASLRLPVVLQGTRM